jgi:hypothetical protein
MGRKIVDRPPKRGAKHSDLLIFQAISVTRVGFGTDLEGLATMI